MIVRFGARRTILIITSRPTRTKKTGKVYWLQPTWSNSWHDDTQSDSWKQVLLAALTFNVFRIPPRNCTKQDVVTSREISSNRCLQILGLWRFIVCPNRKSVDVAMCGRFFFSGRTVVELTMPSNAGGETNSLSVQRTSAPSFAIRMTPHVPVDREDWLTFVQNSSVTCYLIIVSWCMLTLKVGILLIHETTCGGEIVAVLRTGTRRDVTGRHARNRENVRRHWS